MIGVGDVLQLTGAGILIAVGVFGADLYPEFSRSAQMVAGLVLGCTGLLMNRMDAR